MSIASPETREDLKEYIKTKLGAPVLQINVSDEQMDVAINDAFQWFYERQHFNATEQVYLSVKVTDELKAFFKTGEISSVAQLNVQPVYADGMVQTLTLVAAGTGYPLTTGVKDTDDLTDVSTSGGTGEGLTVTVGDARTTAGGLTTVSIRDAGKGYTVGDQITILAGNEDCVFEVTALKTESPLLGVVDFKQQNNYLVLPDSVIGVNRILKSNNYMYAWGFGVPLAGGMAGGLMVGGGMGMGSMGGNFDLTSYYAMQQYLATLQWNLFPPISYNFNQRTHRLHIHSDNFNGVKTDDYLVFECDVKADPDLFPEVYNDMFLKQLATAYVQLAWGRNLSKYQQVQLPGGITMNGDQILNDAKEEIATIKERFSLDYGDYALDLIG